MMAVLLNIPQDVADVVEDENSIQGEPNVATTYNGHQNDQNERFQKLWSDVLTPPGTLQGNVINLNGQHFYSKLESFPL